MAIYYAQLTPNLRTEGTEGNLDNSILHGKSQQRTAYIEVTNGGHRKIVEVKDQVNFTDTIDTLATNPNISVISSD